MFSVARHVPLKALSGAALAGIVYAVGVSTFLPSSRGRRPAAISPDHLARSLGHLTGPGSGPLEHDTRGAPPGELSPSAGRVTWAPLILMLRSAPTDECPCSNAWRVGAGEGTPQLIIYIRVELHAKIRRRPSDSFRAPSPPSSPATSPAFF